MAASVILVAPGDDLGDAAAFAPGPGAYVAGGRVIAALAGVRTESASLSAEEGAAAGEGAAALPLVGVDRGGEGAAVVPEPGDLVLARVTRITATAATCEILVVNGARLPSGSTFAAVLRREHVASGEIDAIAMDASFRPGDLVQATVGSLGDARSFFLTTAAPHLGVVVAHAADGSGRRLVAAAHNAMVDPATGAREARKVARIERGSLAGGSSTTAAPVRA
jgi:exosome complex component CSL4